MFKLNEDLFRTLHNDEKATESKNYKNFCYKCNNILFIGTFNERYKYYCYKDNVRKVYMPHPFLKGQI